MKRRTFRFFLFWLGLLSISACFAQPIRYIMDTDMGFDDWLAIEYLLEQPVDVAAITVDCQGLSYCPPGGENAAKLTHLTQRFVPIAVGNTRANSHYDFPEQLRHFSSAMKIPGFEHIPADQYNHSLKAAPMIVDTVVNAAKHQQKVVIISIGTATNIADAWQLAVSRHQQRLFHQGLAMIYKGGGAFGDIHNKHISNHHIPGNINIPGIVSSKNNAAEWNIYANAPAMQTLLAADLPITFIPNNATDQANMTKTVYQQLIKRSGLHSPRRFVANAMLSTIKLQGGWDKVSKNLDFWDTAVTLTSLDPTLATRTFHQVPMTIITQPGAQYAATWVKKDSPHHANVYYHLSVDKFYHTLLSNLH